MLLPRLKDTGLLFSVNFLDPTSDSGLQAYRGELVLIEGEVGDDKGHIKPPQKVVRGAVVLAGEKIQMLVGALDEVADIHLLLDKYQADFAADMQGLLYIVNLAKPMQYTVGGVRWVLIPLVQGVPWNETMEELAMEKSDFKGQSPADKVATLYANMQSWKSKYAEGSLEEALVSLSEAKREVWGAV